jgi:hypothetical protein
MKSLNFKSKLGKQTTKVAVILIGIFLCSVSLVLLLLLETPAPSATHSAATTGAASTSGYTGNNVPDPTQTEPGASAYIGESVPDVVQTEPSDVTTVSSGATDAQQKGPDDDVAIGGGISGTPQTVPEDAAIIGGGVPETSRTDVTATNGQVSLEQFIAMVKEKESSMDKSAIDLLIAISDSEEKKSYLIEAVDRIYIGKINARSEEIKKMDLEAISELLSGIAFLSETDALSGLKSAAVVSELTALRDLLRNVRSLDNEVNSSTGLKIRNIDNVVTLNIIVRYRIKSAQSNQESVKYTQNYFVTDYMITDNGEIEAKNNFEAVVNSDNPDVLKSGETCSIRAVKTGEKQLMNQEKELISYPNYVYITDEDIDKYNDKAAKDAERNSDIRKLKEDAAEIALKITENVKPS